MRRPGLLEETPTRRNVRRPWRDGTTWWTALRTGKSSVHDELIRRRLKAIVRPCVGVPSRPCYRFPRGGPSCHDNFMWDEEEALRELGSPQPEVLFVCGSSRNRDRFLRYFTKVFNLCIDDDTMRRRLEERTDGDWPLGREGVELMLDLNRRGERPAEAIDIDATQPLDHVVDELLRLAN